MSRGTLRFVVAVVVLAGGLTLATPQAEAAEREARDHPGFWSLALEWIGEVWRAEVFAWEMQGWMIDPNGNQGTTSSEEGGGDQGWMIDPNG